VRKVLVRFDASYSNVTIFVSVSFDVSKDMPEDEIVAQAQMLLSAEEAIQPAILDEVIYL
jgi:hypothetical protein